MLNLSFSKAAAADSPAVESMASGVDSPMTAGGAEGAGGTSSGGRGKAFGAMLSSALGAVSSDRVAGAEGKGLPVPALQEQELGASTSLITPSDTEQPGEDTLFAFAVSQGLDASLVASVLWPGPDGPGAVARVHASADGQGGIVDPASAAEAISALLAGVVTGQVTPNDGIRAGASLLVGLGGGAALTPTQAAAGGWLSLSPASGAAAAGLAAAQARGGSGAGVLTGATLQSAGQPGSGFADRILGATGLSTAMAPSAAAALALSAEPDGGTGPAGAALSMLGLKSMPGTSPAIDPAKAASALLAGASAGAAAASPLAAGAVPAAGDAGLVSVAAVSGGLAGALSASAGGPGGFSSMPAQWVLQPARFQIQTLAGDPLRSASGDPDERSTSTDAGSGAIASGVSAADADNVGLAIQRSQGSGGHQPSFSRDRDVLDLSIDPAGKQAPGGDGQADRLSQRLAEGLAQRMSSQLANNNWKLNLELRPAHLGNVSVEMSMQHGRLEAVFDAGQANARALITEGLDRLKQELQKAGMNVAHLGLSFGSGASGGGKSTPGEQREASADPAGGLRVEASDEPVARRRGGGEGLDVMV